MGPVGGASVTIAWEPTCQCLRSRLREDFAAAVNRKAPDGLGSTGLYTLSIGRLKSVLLARFPMLNDGRLLDRIARVFDADGSGTIDFVEFAAGLGKVVAPQNEHDLLEVGWSQCREGRRSTCSSLLECSSDVHLLGVRQD